MQLVQGKYHDSFLEPCAWSKIKQALLLSFNKAFIYGELGTSQKQAVKQLVDKNRNQCFCKMLTLN